MDQNIVLSRARYDAVIFDLDGVITRTAKVHFEAWRRLFREYPGNREHGGRGNDFDWHDYRRYVDGKPRYEGVESFLDSRGIRIAYGDPRDPPGKETVCGLGNLKNSYFRELIEKNGVEVYEPAVALVRKLRRASFKTGVVSSSKNCVAILKAAGLRDLFDTKLDGADAGEMGLEGKPAPDVFLAASGKLGAKPGRSVVLEDAIAGVEAGRSGGFGLVIGVDRGGNAEQLVRHGADKAVADLSAIRVEAATPSTSDPIPSALVHFSGIAKKAGNREPAVFLDYDGTLTPIVRNPSDAVLSDEMRSVLVELSAQMPLAVISGRDRSDVEKLVGIKGIYYAGSHGFDIAGPDGKEVGPENGKEFLPALDQAEKELRERLGAVAGVFVERKKFSIAMHYRNAAENQIPRLRTVVKEAKANHPELRLSEGKKIFELQPEMDWHKGRALTWLIEKLGIDSSTAVPFYIGDDTTDEDAFKAVRNIGIGVVVMDSYRETEAQYRLKNIDEVESFLRKLLILRKGERK